MREQEECGEGLHDDLGQHLRQDQSLRHHAGARQQLVPDPRQPGCHGPRHPVDLRQARRKGPAQSRLRTEAKIRNQDGVRRAFQRAEVCEGGWPDHPSSSRLPFRCASYGVIADRKGGRPMAKLAAMTAVILCLGITSFPCSARMPKGTFAHPTRCW